MCFLDPQRPRVYKHTTELGNTCLTLLSSMEIVKFHIQRKAYLSVYAKFEPINVVILQT